VCVCVWVSNGSGGKKTPRKIGKGEIVQVNDPFPSIFIERIYNLWQENCLVAEYLAATTAQTTLRCSAVQVVVSNGNIIESQSHFLFCVSLPSIQRDGCKTPSCFLERGMIIAFAIRLGEHVTGLLFLFFSVVRPSSHKTTPSLPLPAP
jgi:hypothetical protein